jgi:hypothetical protein
LLELTPQRWPLGQHYGKVRKCRPKGPRYKAAGRQLTGRTPNRFANNFNAFDRTQGPDEVGV